ncbi:MAG: WYL domain-containing protein [Nitrospirae bacterium]|nr:MAG: WYL domain-containing protein [Nitrospirota bacterium]
MSSKLAFERFIWFHEQVKAGGFPNTGHLARQFEISQRTAQRNIEFMRDRLGAPLLYNKDKRGYLYSDDSYELPPQRFSEESVMALSLAVRLSSSVPDEKIKHDLCSVLAKILGRRRGKAFCFEDIAEKISVKNIEYSRTTGGLFHNIVTAIFKSNPLVISYYSPHTREQSSRVIMPLHLLHYMGSWHLVAYCTNRKGLRDFVLARIKSVEQTSSNVILPDNLPPVKEYVRHNFGIMQGGKTFAVRLLFAPSVAEWISEQVWHPEQKTIAKKDGSLLMRFPASDHRELKKKILAHGANVVVVSPKSLAEEIKNEIHKMSTIYQDYDII